jgi:ABC-2 type transport system permease protein
VGPFIKKDIVVLSRQKSELMILLLMPFILIAILGFALGGIMDGDTETLHMQVAIVVEDDEQHGVERFSADMEDLSFPDEVIHELQSMAMNIRPYTLLQDVFSNEDLRDLIETAEMDEQAAREALAEEDIVAILTVPEHFTYHALQKMLLDEGEGSELHITVNNYDSPQSIVFHNIVDSFVRSLNFESALIHALGEETETFFAAGSSQQEVGDELGGLETIASREPISSFQYYTLGMVVMFVLFVAGIISEKAYVEKKQHVYNRILLSDRHPFVYLGGKVVSTVVITCCQLLILFSLSALVFRTFALETAAYWLGMAAISIMLAVCVGAISALLTALTVRFENEAFSGIFSSGIVSMLALAGGSFFPVSAMPEMVQSIGGWTPNGAALSAYMQWMQGLGAEALLTPLGRMAVFSVLVLIVSVLIFPQRRLN